MWAAAQAQPGVLSLALIHWPNVAEELGLDDSGPCTLMPYSLVNVPGQDAVNGQQQAQPAQGIIQAHW